MHRKAYLLLCLILWIQYPASVFSEDQQVEDTNYFAWGHSECPCLRNLTDFPVNDADLSEETTLKIGVDWFSNSYGVGCAAHDEKTPQCTNNTVCKNLLNVVPTPLNCDTSWCSREWCFIDPNNCKLLNRRSPAFPESGRFYSYATCGDADAFTSGSRFASLQGRVLRVGLNSNSGGWMGVYSSDGEHFTGPAEKWRGPLIAFMREAALRGRFSLNITVPPESLRPASKEFFGGDSSFDFCVYATSLGYLDLCFAQYSITNQRAAVTSWMASGTQEVYLIAINEAIEASGWDLFFASAFTIFTPFSIPTWIFIVFFVIPVLGSLMIIHEQDAAGSQYPREELVVVEHEDGRLETKMQRIPYWRTIVKSIYINTLALLQSSYEQSVITIGAMCNLLGISFFILTLIAVYTANLAAILVQSGERTTVRSLKEAVDKGYRFCAERTNMEAVIEMNSDIIGPEHFVIDSRSVGGDGRPGYMSGNSRTRAFDMISPSLARYDSNYCHAGVAAREDLDVLYSQSKHCNKTKVGQPLKTIQTGIPIFESEFSQLGSFFLKLKYDGVYDKQMMASQPEPRCVAFEADEGEALSIGQLSGIWIISFSFAMAGLLHTFGSWYYKKKLDRSKYKVRSFHKRNQRGDIVGNDFASSMKVTPKLQAALTTPSLQGSQSESNMADEMIIFSTGQNIDPNEPDDFVSGFQRPERSNFTYGVGNRPVQTSDMCLPTIEETVSRGSPIPEDAVPVIEDNCAEHSNGSDTSGSKGNLKSLIAELSLSPR